VSWVKVDDKAWSHPKFAGLTGNAVRLWLFAMCWSAGHETDGRLPKVVLRTLGATQKEAKALVDVGLWHETPDGWEVHDFLEYQPSAEDNRTRREAKAQAGRAGGLTSGKTRREAKGKQGDEHERSTNEAPASQLVHPPAKQNATPVPVPVPVPDPQLDQDPTTSGGSGKIPVPNDLSLTEGQAATLLSTPGIPQWAQDRMTVEFIASHQADPNDKRTLVVWRKCLSKAMCGTWNNSAKRPRLESPGVAAVPAETPEQKARRKQLEAERDEEHRRKLREEAAAAQQAGPQPTLHELLKGVG
jgi:hypothetical protein